MDPFRVEFSISILNAEFFEKLTHSSLKKYRIKRNREFFKVDIKLIKETLRQIQLKSNNGKKKIKSVGNLLSK